MVVVAVEFEFEPIVIRVGRLGWKSKKVSHCDISTNNWFAIFVSSFGIYLKVKKLWFPSWFGFGLIGFPRQLIGFPSWPVNWAHELVNWPHQLSH